MQIENWQDLQPHKLAELVDRMTPTEQNDLNKNIKANGLRFPIVVVRKPGASSDSCKAEDFEIGDGRNRHEACVVGNVDPDFWEFPANGDLRGFIISTLQRKNLTWAEKTGAIKKLLAEQPDLSSRSVAKEFGVSHHTVEKLRQEGTPEQIGNGHAAHSEAEPDSSGQGGSPEQAPHTAEGGEPTGVSDAAPPAAAPVERVTKEGRRAPGRKPDTPEVRAAKEEAKRQQKAAEVKPKTAPQEAGNEWVAQVGTAFNRNLSESLEVVTIMMRDYAELIAAISESQRRSFMDNCIKAFGLRPTEF